MTIPDISPKCSCCCWAWGDTTGLWWCLLEQDVERCEGPKETEETKETGEAKVISR